MRLAGYQLLQDGLVELSQVERNGIRIDMDRLAETKARLGKQIRVLQEELVTMSTWQIWRRRFGEKANLRSHAQQAVIFYEECGHPTVRQTNTGRPVMDEEAMQEIDDPFAQKLLRLSKYEKALGTFLRGIEQEIQGDRLHPSFSLHTASSFRSSSDSPNFQNFPVRDKEIAKVIRSLFIPSPNCVLVENDFKGLEVTLSAAYHKDPVFISYIANPDKDMHRDMAAQLYMLRRSQVSKEIRYCAKNMFVFPQFYGDFYPACARSLWKAIPKLKLLGPDGKSLYRHLKAKGIAELGACDPEESPEEGTFEAHVRDVEKDFWGRRFRKYGQWKRDWYDKYMERGYFDLLTGFRIQGAFRRNQVVNLPVQGAAFHCLLWSLIRVNRILRKRKMKSMIIGQIHDSLLGDVRIDELGEYLRIVEHVTMNELPRHWDWLIVPPVIEYEICLPGQTWFDKQPIHFRHGLFIHPRHPNRVTSKPRAFLKALAHKP